YRYEKAFDAAKDMYKTTKDVAYFRYENNVDAAADHRDATVDAAKTQKEYVDKAVDERDPRSGWEKMKDEVKDFFDK
ncbi:MAG: hypothetical protein LUC93_12745, partial [Planctomycetaceae bacterium]|nr:hypothetical protein [Planctomycetaceae bacterium]